ncbi:MAG TPA: hypothetical protein VJZ27_13035, partial [Aggregatilineales bacterium]|nr:hypothetical protein [Aggregatilineales bacterium]
MSHFFAPVDNPASWNYSIETVEIPAGLRYAGYSLRGLHLTNAAATAVRAAARGTLRQITSPAQHVIQLQVNPIFVQQIVGELDGGLPTLYYIFPATSAPSTPFEDDTPMNGAALLHTTTELIIVMTGQDRITRDPSLYAAHISAA